MRQPRELDAEPEDKEAAATASVQSAFSAAATPDWTRPPQAAGHSGPRRGTEGVENVIKARTGQVLDVDAPAPGVGWP
jgi:hypothetical protein